MSLTMFILFCVIFSAVPSIVSASTKQNYKLQDLNENEREKRSPRCGTSNCGGGGGLVINQQTLIFQGPVAFNTYITSPDCGGSCEPNCGSSCDKPIVSNTSDVTTTTEAAPAPYNKTKIFPVEFNIGKAGLDIYYLMDATITFEKDRKILAGLAPELINSIRQLVPDSQIGFGLFSDKLAYNLANYGLWNKMPLTNDTSNFAYIIENTITMGGGIVGTGNDEEDALTGLHQAAACISKINWRADTLRMLLLTTDDGYKVHSGKGAAYDGHCHLDANGQFTGTEYNVKIDFPTEDDIKNIIKKNIIKVIFAIKESRITVPSIPDIYRTLSARIDPMPVVLALGKDSSNIIQVVKDAYAAATKEVVLETTLNGTKPVIEAAEVAVRCMRNPTTFRDDEFVPITKNVNCTVQKDGIVAFEIEVKLPCPVDTKDFTLKANAQGHAIIKSFDLTHFCD